MTEKRAEYRKSPQISLDFDMQSDSYGLFAMVNVGEFKRVFSNLVNNAVEACPTEEG